VARGKAIAVETFNLLSTNLQLALQSGGISNALPFCSLAASPLTANMAEKYGVTLRRITHKARNPAAKADALELSILNSFAAALTTTTNPPPAFATNLVLNQVTFFAPIVIHHELCLQCHGEPGRILPPKTSRSSGIITHRTKPLASSCDNCAGRGELIFRSPPSPPPQPNEAN
jgi:hypothetical protein